MFHFQETPLHMNEVKNILAMTQAEFKKEDVAGRIARNVTCHFRVDKGFDFPNYLDVLDIGLKRFDYIIEYDGENKEDIILEFIDLFSCGLEGDDSHLKDLQDPIIHNVTRNLRIDPFDDRLRKMAKYGEHLFRSEVNMVRVNQRDMHCCSIAVYLYHRTMQVFYQDAIERADHDDIRLVDQGIAICQGKLCTYFPDIPSMVPPKRDEWNISCHGNLPVMSNF